MKEKTIRDIGLGIGLASGIIALAFGGKMAYNEITGFPKKDKETAVLFQRIDASNERISQLSRGVQRSVSAGLIEDNRREELPAGLPEEYLRFVQQSKSNELAMLNGYINSATQDPKYVAYLTAVHNTKIPKTAEIGYWASIGSMVGGFPIFCVGLRRMERERANSGQK